MSELNARESWIKTKVRPRSILAIYNTVERALWSCLIAAVIMFAVFVLPRLPEMHRQQASTRILQIEAEKQFYCQRLGKTAGTDDFSRCMIELQAYRQNVEKRMAEESDF
jgi:hypothetical protein